MEKYVHVFLVNSWRMEERPNQRKQKNKKTRPRRCQKIGQNKSQIHWIWTQILNTPNIFNPNARLSQKKRWLQQQ